jgi:hypothetical protein
MDDNQIAADEPKTVWMHRYEAFHGLSFLGFFDRGSSCMFPNARVVVLISANWLCLSLRSESRIRIEMRKETPELLSFFLVQCH